MLRIRIVGTDGPGRTFATYGDVRVGLQVRKEVTAIVRGDLTRASWETEAKLLPGADGGLLVRGPAIHGGGGERFLYLAWLDGETMFRRAKLQLDVVPATLLRRAEKGGVLVGELGLTDGKGGPICASVRPPAIRWSFTAS